MTHRAVFNARVEIVLRENKEKNAPNEIPDRNAGLNIVRSAREAVRGSYSALRSRPEAFGPTQYNIIFIYSRNSVDVSFVVVV